MLFQMAKVGYNKSLSTSRVSSVTRKKKHTHKEQKVWYLVFLTVAVLVSLYSNIKSKSTKMLREGDCKETTVFGIRLPNLEFLFSTRSSTVVILNKNW